MCDAKRSAVRYRFTEVVDLLVAFERVGIEHLEVSSERTIVIYNRTIFNCEVPDEHLKNVQTVAVKVFEVSPDRSATGDPDPLSLTERLIDERATTMGVNGERHSVSQS